MRYHSFRFVCVCVCVCLSLSSSRRDTDQALLPTVLTAVLSLPLSPSLYLSLSLYICTDPDQPLLPMVLTAVLSFHSFMGGVALGVQTGVHETVSAPLPFALALDPPPLLLFERFPLRISLP